MWEKNPAKVARERKTLILGRQCRNAQRWFMDRSIGITDMSGIALWGKVGCNWKGGKIRAFMSPQLLFLERVIS
jgi:hypothetical protein